MKRVLLYSGLALVVLFVAAFFWTARLVDASSIPSRGAYRASWSPAAAASYLDYREEWWQGWHGSQLDHGTVCISCHTALPFALVRTTLSAQLGGSGPAPAEQRMIESIQARVTEWPHTTSYYTDPAHAAPSRATESVLNAFILSTYENRDSQYATVSRRAFAEAWALQNMTGSNAGGWQWQNFHEAPWESSESAYWGAALMGIAVANMPLQYREEADVREHLGALQQYLRRNYADQPLINQVYVIRAAAEMPGLLSSDQRSEFVTRIDALQQPDGGWALAALDGRRTLKAKMLDVFRRVDDVDGSDGCGTGLAVLGLEKAGVSPQAPDIQRGLRWLEQHQYQDGSWWAPSLNGLRKPDSELGRFMSDAATGYAVLAMEQARTQKIPSSATTVPAGNTPIG